MTHSLLGIAIISVKDGGDISLDELRDYLKRVKLRNDGSPEFESIRSSYKRRIMFDKNGLGVDIAYAELKEMFGEGS